MSKYIDSEKLIAELTKMQFSLNATYRKPQADNIVRAISLEYDDIVSLVSSLQQESKDKNVFIQKAIQWMCKTAPIDDVLSVEMIEDFKKTMMED